MHRTLDLAFGNAGRHRPGHGGNAEGARQAGNGRRRRPASAGIGPGNRKPPVRAAPGMRLAVRPESADMGAHNSGTAPAYLIPGIACLPAPEGAWPDWPKATV